jgi:UPF0755 protein
MRRLLLLMFVLALGTGLYVFMRVQRYLDRPMGQGHQTVVIPEGSSYREAVNALYSAGVVTDWTVFYWMGRWRGIDRGIKAGTYAVNRAWTPRQLMDRLGKGALPQQTRLTIPEGYNRWQIADRLAQMGVDRKAFLQLVRERDLEGRLFPDTYYIKPGSTAAQLADMMARRFDGVFAKLLEGHPDAAKYADPARRRQLIIMASLVEEEAITDRDRGLVARVFYNRIAKGMRLQTDPTCVYGERLYKKVPHPRYCKDPKSRYSTYVIKGLPPGPISNPGKAALNAALRPASAPGTEELLYFVARRDGSKEHAFSRTFAEHKAAVRKYLKGGR